MGCCFSQCIPKQCFRATARRKSPDVASVPATPQFDAAWLTDALRRSGDLPPNGVVASADVGEILLEVEGGEDIKNGGGIAGGRTVRGGRGTRANKCGESRQRRPAPPHPARYESIGSYHVPHVGGSA